MEEKTEKIFYLLTCAAESPEKASVPFVLGNAALAMDIGATVCLQSNGVYLATKRVCRPYGKGWRIPAHVKTHEGFYGSGRKAVGVCALYQGAEYHRSGYDRRCGIDGGWQSQSGSHGIECGVCVLKKGGQS